jgi:hypothetical protein
MNTVLVLELMSHRQLLMILLNENFSVEMIKCAGAGHSANIFHGLILNLVYIHRENLGVFFIEKLK